VAVAVAVAEEEETPWAFRQVALLPYESDLLQQQVAVVLRQPKSLHQHHHHQAVAVAAACLTKCAQGRQGRPLAAQRQHQLHPSQQHLPLEGQPHHRLLVVVALHQHLHPLQQQPQPSILASLMSLRSNSTKRRPSVKSLRVV